MIKCPFCGTTHVANTLFCSECGTYLLEDDRRGTDPLGTDEIGWVGEEEGEGDASAFVKGYGENSRVLKWVFERVMGTAKAVDTPIGRLPEPGALDVSGLGVAPGAMDELLRVDVEGWTAQLAEIRKHYEKFGAKLPQGLKDELAALEQRLQGAATRA